MADFHPHVLTTVLRALVDPWCFSGCSGPPRGRGGNSGRMPHDLTAVLKNIVDPIVLGAFPNDLGLLVAGVVTVGECLMTLLLSCRIL